MLEAVPVSEFAANASDAGELVNDLVVSGEIVGHELVEVIVAASAGEHLHEIGRGEKEVLEPYGRLCDLQPGAEMIFLSGDSDGAIVRVAHAHRDATDCLHDGIRNRDRIRAERERLGKIRGCAQTAGDDERNVIRSRLVQMPPRSRQGGNGWNRDVIAENARR